MSEISRVLIARCGCIAAADMSDDKPGFCRTKAEAAQDYRDGWTETTMPVETVRATMRGCSHSPKWGRP